MAQITLNSSGVASSGSLVLQTNGTTAVVTIDGTDLSTTGSLKLGNGNQTVSAENTNDLQLSASSGSANILFRVAGAERGRITSAGNLGIGTSSPIANGGYGGLSLNGTSGALFSMMTNGTETTRIASIGDETSIQCKASTGVITFVSGVSGGTERARITTGGALLIGQATENYTNNGVILRAGGSASFTVTNNEILDINRLSSDGQLVRFYGDSTQEGNIAISGTTVSYNGGHLSRYAQTTTAKDESVVKGTVLSNLDAMNVYTDAEGNPVDNEQLNKVKVSDVEGDANVAGVFVNWSHDEQHNVDEINMAMTGDMIIRIAQGVTVVRGDLLISAGNGTAKPQGDDIVRSKTVAKVTSNHVTCTYADGSYCVPCVLMAC